MTVDLYHLPVWCKGSSRSLRKGVVRGFVGIGVLRNTIVMNIVGIIGNDLYFTRCV